MALAKLGLDYGSGASDDEGWGKALGCKAPEDADPWTAALHTIISHVYGAGTETAVVVAAPAARSLGHQP